MVRKDDPRRGASHLVISKSWSNPANAVYHRRLLFGLMRRAFRIHLQNGGRIYQYELTVGSEALDDEALVKAERREWDRVRKRLQRAGALFRWFSSITSEGVFRVIYSTAPAFDGHRPVEYPESELLETLKVTSSLREPYRRRPAHGGPADAWRPKRTVTGEWTTVGSRSAAALLESGQDTYDEAEATANEVETWRASTREVNARSPETILRTRHWVAPQTKPLDLLFNLWNELGFDMSEKAWVHAFGDRPGSINQSSVADPSRLF